MAHNHEGEVTGDSDRFRNMPPSDETTATRFCPACGTDDLDVRREGMFDDWRDVATCNERDCGHEWEVLE